MWKPSATDTAWAANFVGTLRDGAVWALPCNATVYRIDKSRKVLALVEGPKDDVFDKTVATFTAVGYTVTDERQLAVHGP